MSTPLETAIEDAAALAKRLKAGENEREAHSLTDLVAADKYLAGRAASNRSTLPFRVFATRPPGAS